MNFLCNCGMVFCKDQREALQNMFFNSFFQKNDSQKKIEQIYNNNNDNNNDNNDNNDNDNDNVQIDTSDNNNILEKDIINNEDLYCIPITKKRNNNKKKKK